MLAKARGYPQPCTYPQIAVFADAVADMHIHCGCGCGYPQNTFADADVYKRFVFVELPMPNFKHRRTCGLIVTIRWYDHNFYELEFEIRCNSLAQLFEL